MNSEDLVFVNQQLASMSSSGIPLEGALRDVARNVKSGKIKANLTKLAARLEAGESLEKSISDLDFPHTYKNILICGAQSENMAQALNSAADFYQSQSTAVRLLKSAVFYPFMTLALLLVVSLIVGWTVTNSMVVLDIDGMGVLADGQVPQNDVTSNPENSQFSNSSQGVSFLNKVGYLIQTSPANAFLIWLTPLALMLLFICAFLTLAIKPVRNWLMWSIPGFREGNIALAAALLASMHRSGVDWATSLYTISHMYGSTPVGVEFQMYYNQIKEGRGNTAEILSVRGPMPRLFRWIIASGGEKLQQSLENLSMVYRDRSRYFHDLLLTFISPAAILVAAMFIVGQSIPVMVSLIQTVERIGL